MKTLILITSLLLVISGCASFDRYRIQVDSISDLSPTVGSSYVLISAVEGVGETSIEYKELVSSVNQTLKAIGHHESADFDTADLAILLTYGIDDPQYHHYSYSSLPAKGQIGLTAATTNDIFRSMGSTGTVNNTSAFNPPYDENYHTGIRRTFFKFVTLSAVDLREYRDSGSWLLAWRTTSTSTDSGDDLRRIFPALVSAAAPYIGKNTAQKVAVSLTKEEADERIQQIKSSTQVRRLPLR